MPKSNDDKKDNKSLKRTAQISVRACCFVNPQPTSPPYQRFSPPNDYQTAPPSTPLESPPTTSIAPSEFAPGQLLTTPKTTPPQLTSPPPAPSQPSKQTSPLAINLEPVELIFSTPPTSPRPFFDSLEDLPPRTTNPPDQNLPVTKGIPVSDFKDLFDYGIRNHVALEETGDPTREAAVYSYIAASLLRLFTKPASNYVSSWSSILKSFSKFYDEPMNVALPTPIELALKTIESRLAFDKAERVTLYRFLYVSNLDESHKELM
ncbi:E-beta-farnesene synthase [Tanacetum coccineum]